MAEPKASSPDRAVVFIDGNNWYHSLKDSKVRSLFDLDYAAISSKLVGPREWRGTRYYIGALKDHHRGYRDQRRFLSQLKNQDSRITVHYGRIEDRPQVNELSKELLRLLGQNPGQLNDQFKAQLVELGRRHRHVSMLKEKAADVMLAVDMCRLAREDEFDAAYLLSADGDFTPAVEFVRSLGKKVYAASPATCAALGQCANSFIPLKWDWFQDCYR